MARKPDPDQLERIYLAFQEHPGKRPGFIARLLGESRSQITRSLPTLEERGYLLSEDERGRIFPYQKLLRE